MVTADRRTTPPSLVWRSGRMTNLALTATRALASPVSRTKCSALCPPPNTRPRSAGPASGCRRQQQPALLLTRSELTFKKSSAGFGELFRAVNLSHTSVLCATHGHHVQVTCTTVCFVPSVPARHVRSLSPTSSSTLWQCHLYSRATFRARSPLWQCHHRADRRETVVQTERTPWCRQKGHCKRHHGADRKDTMGQTERTTYCRRKGHHIANKKDIIVQTERTLWCRQKGHHGSDRKDTFVLTERLRVFSDSAVPVRVRITALAAGVRGCDVVCDVQPAVTSLGIELRNVQLEPESMALLRASDYTAWDKHCVGPCHVRETWQTVIIVILLRSLTDSCKRSQLASCEELFLKGVGLGWR